MNSPAPSPHAAAAPETRGSPACRPRPLRAVPPRLPGEGGRTPRRPARHRAAPGTPAASPPRDLGFALRTAGGGASGEGCVSSRGDFGCCVSPPPRLAVTAAARRGAAPRSGSCMGPRASASAACPRPRSPVSPAERGRAVGRRPKVLSPWAGAARGAAAFGGGGGGGAAGRGVRCRPAAGVCLGPWAAGGRSREVSPRAEHPLAPCGTPPSRCPRWKGSRSSGGGAKEAGREGVIAPSVRLSFFFLFLSFFFFPSSLSRFFCFERN